MAHPSLQVSPVVWCKVDKGVIPQTKKVDGVENLAWNHKKGEKGLVLWMSSWASGYNASPTCDPFHCKTAFHPWCPLLLVGSVWAQEDSCFLNSSSASRVGQVIMLNGEWKMDSFFTILLISIVTLLLPGNRIYLLLCYMDTSIDTFNLLVISGVCWFFMWGFHCSVLDLDSFIKRWKLVILLLTVLPFSRSIRWVFKKHASGISGRVEISASVMTSMRLSGSAFPCSGHPCSHVGRSSAYIYAPASWLLANARAPQH